MIGILSILIAIFLLGFFSICGIISLELIGIVFCKNNPPKKRYELAPIIGLCSVLCITQTLNLVLSVKAICILLLPLILYGAYVFRKEILDFLNYMRTQKLLIFTVFFSITLVLLPCIRYNDFVSLCFENNDIIYYLESMDWLKTNSFFEPRVFSSGFPYESHAEYMITTTRIGMDILGAFCMSLIPLRSYQIYWILCALFVALGVFTVTYFCNKVLKMSKQGTVLTAVLLGSGISIVELIRQQYAPQVLGVVLYVTFIALMTEFFFSKNEPDIIPLVALAAITTMAVYSEYASYAVIVLLIAFAIRAISNRNAKATIALTFDCLKVAGLAIIFNIPGFIKAVSFNLNVIVSSLSNLGNIDPYGGQMAGKAKLFYYFTNVWPATYGINGFLRLIIIAAIAIVLVSLVYSFLKGILNKHGALELYLLLSTGFYFAYWVFFRITNYAYGEYKHIHLVLWCLYITAAYFIDFGVTHIRKTEQASREKYIHDTERANTDKNAIPPAPITTWGYIKRYMPNICSITITILVVGGIFVNAFSFNRYSKSSFKFDKRITEMETAIADNIPSGEVLGIQGDIWSDTHIMVYSAKNTGKEISILLRNSYYTFFVGTRHVFPRYVLFVARDGGIYSDFLSSDNYTEIWNNGSFCIMKNLASAGILADNGFSGIRYHGAAGNYRLIGASATFAVKNFSDAPADHQIYFDTCLSDDGVQKAFKVYLGETLIGEGVSGESFRSEAFTLAAGQEAIVTVTVDGGEGENGTGLYNVGITTVN